MKRIAVLMLVLASCVPPAPVAPTACAAACAHGRDLACEWAATTPAGATCEAVCEATEATGYTTMAPACLATAASCAEAERCAP